MTGRVKVSEKNERKRQERERGRDIMIDRQRKYRKEEKERKEIDR